ncbi:hypothetical protein FUA26_10605 [Seonamhaeicola algicola]|uniref:Uncharacterized protein n=1 Tax=Seonamhaeicola algicola TaxID=1719036 RepID=A0A5C7AQG1_9FLAO|nr:hypothetical protein [Seonamhaeicola algicola]TXE09929.1 hypothetical protein FUA26_10605 [Seonamhaeicola algicola]
MKSIFKTFILALTFVLFNCKNTTSNLEYKYTNKPATIACKNTNAKLYAEALYAFEEDILNYYGKNSRNNNAQPNLTYAYNQFIRNAVYSKIPYESVISQHTINVFKALKNDNTLWDANNTKSHLNYNSSLVKCIAENLKNTNLKTTFNALLSVNDLSTKLIGPPIVSNYRSALNDKHLATFIAFEFFYAKLFEVDLTKVNPHKVDTKVDFNKTPTSPKQQ